MKLIQIIRYTVELEGLSVPMNELEIKNFSNIKKYKNLKKYIKI